LNILIAYHSDYGNTRKMAEAIAAGIRAADSSLTPVLKLAEQVSTQDLSNADVIFFGTPIHMGSMAWPMKKLIDEAGKLWMEGLLEGKVGGVFASGGGFGNAGGGVETTMIALHAHFLEQGMVVVGFPKSLPGYADGGLHWGAYGRSGNHEGMPVGVSDKALVAARSYGAHVVEIAAKLT